MQKVILFVILIVSSSSMTSQVRNLNDFVSISRIESIDLARYMYPDWSVSRPYEKESGNLIIGGQTFKTAGQTVERKAVINSETRMRTQITSLTTKNSTLIQDLVEQFKDRGIKLKSRTMNKTTYQSDFYDIEVTKNKKTGESTISLIFEM